MKILIIEDEVSLLDSMAEYLSAQDYQCVKAKTFREALDVFERFEFDCILLDIGLPDGNGLKILEYLKMDKRKDGVVIISAKNSLDDKVNGLELGADDYLTKPFHLSELNARIAAIIRRKSFDGSDVITIDNLSVNTKDKLVCVDGEPVELTRKEYELLLYFISNKKRVISKDAIAEHLCGKEIGNAYDIIYTHIKNLRKKLIHAGCDDLIKSIYGMGYKFSG